MNATITMIAMPRLRRSALRMPAGLRGLRRSEGCDVHCCRCLRCGALFGQPTHRTEDGRRKTNGAVADLPSSVDEKSGCITRTTGYATGITGHATGKTDSVTGTTGYATGTTGYATGKSASVTGTTGHATETNDLVTRKSDLVMRESGHVRAIFLDP
jgi:hypothetical protein